jgi:[ribosomal protein S18]-alanine N-acetyltransferase
MIGAASSATTSTCSCRPALRHQQQQHVAKRRRTSVRATGGADEAPPPPPARALVSVRPARPEDVAAIARLERACAPLSAGWTEGQVGEELSRDIAVALVAVVVEEKEGEGGAAATAANAPDGAVVAGWTAAWRVAGEMQVLAVAVDPCRRRAGLGRALIGALLALAAAEEADGAEERRRGADAAANAADAAAALPPLATLELRADNAAAAALYASCGFVEVGRRKGYYEGGKVDALLLERQRVVG